MERLASPRTLVIAACLSLWTAAFQATLDTTPSERHLPYYPSISQQLDSETIVASNGSAGDDIIVDDGAPMIAAAGGHWF